MFVSLVRMAVWAGHGVGCGAGRGVGCLAGQRARRPAGQALEREIASISESNARALAEEQREGVRLGEALKAAEEKLVLTTKGAPPRPAARVRTLSCSCRQLFPAVA